MKKKWSLIYAYVLMTLLLSACTSVDADAAQKYKQENVLKVDITVPDSIQTGVYHRLMLLSLFRRISRLMILM